MAWVYDRIYRKKMKVLDIQVDHIGKELVGYFAEIQDIKTKAVSYRNFTSDDLNYNKALAYHLQDLKKTQ